MGRQCLFDIFISGLGCEDAHGLVPTMVPLVVVHDPQKAGWQDVEQFEKTFDNRRKSVYRNGCSAPIREGSSLFDCGAATPALFAAACAAEPGSRTSALVYDQAVRAWRKGRQDEGLFANVEKPVFALLGRSVGEQMRSFHEVGQRQVCRAIESLLLAR